MSNNTTDGISNANSAPNTSKSFDTARQEQAYRISQLSPQAQTKAAVLEDVYSKRLAQEKNSQQRSRAFREMKVKTKLLEDYVRSDDPRPNDAHAKANDLKIIDERSKDLVRSKESYYLNRIEVEREASIKQVIREETAQQDQQQVHNPDHAHGADNQPMSQDHNVSSDLEPEQER